jgi:hypothetical protein
MELQEPEMQQMDVSCNDDTEQVRILTVTGEVRIVRNSECCGDEIKEANFSFDEDVEIEGHTGEGHDFSIDEGDLNPLEEGGSRYQKSYYGVEWCPDITCSCGEPVKRLGAKDDDEMLINFVDKVSASSMDDLT